MALMILRQFRAEGPRFRVLGSVGVSGLGFWFQGVGRFIVLSG